MMGFAALYPSYASRNFIVARKTSSSLKPHSELYIFHPLGHQEVPKLD